MRLSRNFNRWLFTLKCLAKNIFIDTLSIAAIFGLLITELLNIITSTIELIGYLFGEPFAKKIGLIKLSRAGKKLLKKNIEFIKWLSNITK